MDAGFTSLQSDKEDIKRRLCRVSVIKKRNTTQEPIRYPSILVANPECIFGIMNLCIFGIIFLR